jgi:hypothetical protein
MTDLRTHPVTWEISAALRSSRGPHRVSCVMTPELQEQCVDVRDRQDRR